MRVSDIAVTAGGKIAVSCWDGRIYFDWQPGQPLKGRDVGGPAVLAAPQNAENIIVATAAGAVRGFDTAGKQQFRADLNQAVHAALNLGLPKRRPSRSCQAFGTCPAGGSKAMAAANGLSRHRMG